MPRTAPSDKSAFGYAHPHVESFFEMMAAERGASLNTLHAYRRDLRHFATTMKQDIVRVSAPAVRRYIERLRDDGFDAATAARRLSALRQTQRRRRGDCRRCGSSSASCSRRAYATTIRRARSMHRSADGDCPRPCRSATSRC
jgi:integrase/recombinase XerD